ncbi:hypothetical protein ACR742_12520 [Flavonifractor plautii]|jgi:hypothetical protein|uniref:hypothetical protein n=1 Tax=Flavonifractor plautii TaxID=292800 RepID=UPI003DA2B529|nr:hypothetical protein [Clostridiales bacterium]
MDKRTYEDDNLNEILLASLGPLSEDGELQLRNPLDELTERIGLREVTTEELAEVLGVCTQRISQLWMSGDIPEPRKEGKRHLFPLLASARGYIQFLKSCR